ncbi:DNA topoisomerase 2 isoform X2 [Bacillus rossius redtenbacheri]|uniref:DNA topoisomerase 2 isoform X2 n=1 Tax=Bacillus rossius redtenbacheri TaxID=93214 RepID=UPI002FDE6BB1
MEVAENGVIPNGDLHSAPKKASSKKLSVEKVYQKKTQLEHILLRPDTYIGSVELVKETMWVYDAEAERMEQREISYVPGLYKIFDEILVNAADNKQRDKSMDCIKVEIDTATDTISVWNNGQGIPVVEHKDEKMFVPTMIFGHLLTSSNYNDEEQKVTGGRNGYGAKLCNIFSTKFTVETAAVEYKRSFKQVWASNMTKTSEPKIKDFFGSDFTKITFTPDLTKFKMEKLDKDIVDLMSRRAFDVAASTRGVKVYLNGKRLPVKNFKDYIDLFIKDKEDDFGKPLSIVYENCNERWEVAVTVSNDGFQQVSFVNSIATTKGGRHVDYVADMITKNLVEAFKKKNKTGFQIKPNNVKSHMWLFINCLIVNPTFDSQTKENMTLQLKNFGSKCELSPKFLTQVAKSAILDAVTYWANSKAQTQLQKTSGKKQSKLKGIPKLEDANDAGTAKSLDCTLILTEGDSAKTLAVSGLGVVGRDKYGVFPLKGKVLNVREASNSQITGNAEINALIKILGLNYKHKYETIDDLKNLRYGRLMIMTDQDQDGSHIKGLLINFIHHNWPSLLKLPFLEEFITPIVKASKSNQELSFYSLPEFEEWKSQTDNWHTYKIKYYKGLGTSTSKEAKEYFSDMARHRIRFKYAGPQDDVHIKMAFSKKCIEERKEWLTNWMEDSKQRRELGLPEQYLYEKDTHQINYTDFVNKELVLFSNLDNERSIPSMVDGLKPGQRKVLYTCMKRKDKREVKVAQLAGSVAEHSAYHHGEASLMSTIINLAQNYVGSNNINMLQPIGQFGTRLTGGKDAASPRYIFTMLSPLAKFIFHPHDEPLLKNQYDDNQKIEPVWYMPVIPMVLVNGADGIGTGWMTKIPNYNPREIIANLKRMLEGEEPKEMTPWYKNFRGIIEKVSHQRYVTFGEVGIIADDKVEITELPIGVWTQNYKESVLEPLLHGAEKTPGQIKDYKEYNTDTTVRFVVTMNAEKLMQLEFDGLHKFFKLQTSFTTTSMCVFDGNLVMRKFESVEDILKEFYTLRLSFYEKRKAYLEGILSAESLKLSNQARFILEKCSGELVVENKKRKVMMDELKKRGYEEDPVYQWKMKQDKEAALAEAQAREDAESSQTEEEQDKLTTESYNYLLGMTMWSLTLEKKEELLRKRDEKLLELKVLREKSPAVLWHEDLDKLLEELERVEAQELEEANSAGKKLAKLGKKQAAVPAKGRRGPGPSTAETLPSPTRRIIQPKADDELKKKFEKAAAVAKVKKTTKKPKTSAEKDEFDLMADGEIKTIEQRIGSSPDMVKKKAAARKKEPSKPRAPKGEGSPKKGKKKNPWESDSDSEGGKKKRRKRKGSDDSSDESALSEVDSFVPPARTTSRRSVAVPKKYTFDSEDEDKDDDDDELVLHDNELDDGHVPVNDDNLDDAVAESQTVIDVSDTDSDFDAPKSKVKSKKGAVPLNTSESMFDSLVGSSSKEDKPEPKKKAPQKKKLWQQEDSQKSVAKKAPAKKKAAKKKDSSDEDSDGSFAPKAKKSKKVAASTSDSETSAPRKQLSGRARKPTKFTFDDDSDGDVDSD